MADAEKEQLRDEVSILLQGLIFVEKRKWGLWKEQELRSNVQMRGQLNQEAIGCLLGACWVVCA